MEQVSNAGGERMGGGAYREGQGSLGGGEVSYCLGVREGRRGTERQERVGRCRVREEAESKR